MSVTGSSVSTRRPAVGAKTDRPFVLRAFVVSYVLFLFLSVFQLLIIRPWMAPLTFFNQDFLPLAENFFALMVYNSRGEKSLIPFFGESGEYLGWQNWSDRAFLGEGMAWRFSLLKTT